MKVGARGTPALAFESDYIPGFHMHAHLRLESGKVPVPGAYAKAVVDHYEAP